MDDLYTEILVRANRIIYTRLMLGLAVKLEAGIAPGAPVK